MRPNLSPPRPALGVALVVTAATVWGLNGVVSKLLIRGGFEPPQLTTFRATGAFLGILVLVLVTRGPDALKARPRELPRLVIYGLIGILSVPLLYFVAISRLPVGIGLLFEFTAPAFVALWVRFGEHQRVRRRLWLGLVLCLAGLVSVAQLWSVADDGLRLDGLGILAGVGSAVLLAAWYILGSRYVAGDTPTRDPLTLTCWGFGVAALVGSLITPWWRFDAHLLTGRVGTTPMWLLAAYLIVFGTIVPYLLLTFSMRHLPPTSVGIVGMVEILLASSFAWVLLHESLAPVQIIGGTILIVGVALAESARVTRTAPGRSPASPHHPKERLEDPRGESPTVPAGR